MSAGDWSSEVFFIFEVYYLFGVIPFWWCKVLKIFPNQFGGEQRCDVFDQKITEAALVEMETFAQVHGVRIPVVKEFK